MFELWKLLIGVLTVRAVRANDQRSFLAVVISQYNEWVFSSPNFDYFCQLCHMSFLPPSTYHLIPFLREKYGTSPWSVVGGPNLPSDRPKSPGSGGCVIQESLALIHNALKRNREEKQLSPIVKFMIIGINWILKKITCRSFSIKLLEFWNGR